MLYSNSSAAIYFTCESGSFLVVSHSLWPHGLCSPWTSPGQSTEVGSLSLLQGSSQPRDQTKVSHISGRFFTSWATRETHFTYGSIYMSMLLSPVIPLSPSPTVSTSPFSISVSPFLPCKWVHHYCTKFFFFSYLNFHAFYFFCYKYLSSFLTTSHTPESVPNHDSYLPTLTRWDFLAFKFIFNSLSTSVSLSCFVKVECFMDAVVIVYVIHQYVWQLNSDILEIINNYYKIIDPKFTLK